MACAVIHTWTLCSLVGAFLDLGLAYLVLCGSAIAFFAAKFLGVFGLSLPCPCNGLFGEPYFGNGCSCMQRVLVEYPARRISSVQMLAQRRFPFDRIRAKGYCNSNVKLLEGGEIHDRLLETASGDGPSNMVEAICSYSEGQGTNNLVMNDAYSSTDQDGDNFAVHYRNGRTLEPKGKALWNPKPRPVLRRRRKACTEYGKTSNAASGTHLKLVGQGNSVCTSEQDQETSNQSFAHRRSRGSVPHFVESSYGDRFVQRPSSGNESNGTVGEHNVMVEGSHERRKFSENEPTSSQDLKQALEEERAARSALYLELEMERSAAATAADEAMAMISRLQEEKALIEMEARQYQRMIEEKAAYDAEEMNILKEILLRREREKLVLEKEVEVYREMLFSGKSEQSEEDVQCSMEVTSERVPGHSFDMNDDPGLLLQQISASLVKKKAFKDVNKFPTMCFESQLEVESNWKEQPLCSNAKNENSAKHLDVYCSSSSKGSGFHGFESNDKHSNSAEGSPKRFDLQFDEKTMLSIGGPTFSHVWPLELQDSTVPSQLCCHLARGMNDGATSPHAEHKLNGNKGRSVTDIATPERCQCPCGSTKEHDILLNGLGQLGDHVDAVDSLPSESRSFPFDPESCVYDVHVVNDNVQISNIDSGQENGILSSRTKYSSILKNKHSLEASGMTKGDVSNDPSNSSKNEEGLSLVRSSSGVNLDMHKRDDPALSFNLRRHSISVVDSEKLRLNNEVGWLIERLRTVQEGREKLNLSLGHKEKEKIHLQLLEEIAQQLREICQLTEPGKAVRQASLPSPSSKASSKKRRCRSVSWGLNEST